MEIEGLDGILERIDDLVDFPKIEASMKTCVALVERSAKQKAHKIRRTGTLANSIASEVKRDGDNVVGIVFTPLEYAPYVEYGTGLFAEKGDGRKTPWLYEDEATGETIFTRGQKPQPYLRPALNENREKIANILKGSISE